ncbi:MAG: redoxin domain-containing protein [Aureispira sp.]|nr:redoxin domain-containing protein [Aureispira sp.]
MVLDPEILEVIYTNEGEDLLHLSQKNTVMLLFLRHFGCTFCRESLTDISKIRKEIEDLGIKIVAIHMAEEEVADEYFKNYNLANLTHISDPDVSLYDYFGLSKGRFFQLYGLKVWLRGLKAGILDGHGLKVSSELGSFQQMPGVFMLKDGQIITKFVHKSASDRPDYKDLVNKTVSKNPTPTTDKK